MGHHEIMLCMISSCQLTNINPVQKEANHEKKKKLMS